MNWKCFHEIYCWFHLSNSGDLTHFHKFIWYFPFTLFPLQVIRTFSHQSCFLQFMYLRLWYYFNVNCLTSRYFCTISFLVQILYFIFIFAIRIFIKITRKIVHSPTENYTYVTKNNQQWNIIHCKFLMCVLTDI